MYQISEIDLKLLIEILKEFIDDGHRNSYYNSVHDNLLKRLQDKLK